MSEGIIGRRADWAVGERGAGGGPGAPGPTVRGSTLFLGAGAGGRRNYSHPQVINSAAPAPVRVRQRYPCPSTYPPSSHSPSSFFSPGRGRASPPLAPPRLTSDALRRLHLPPARSRLLRAHSRPLLRPGSRCPPAEVPRHLSESHFIRFQSLPVFYCGLLCCVLWIYF